MGIRAIATVGSRSRGHRGAGGGGHLPGAAGGSGARARPRAGAGAEPAEDGPGPLPIAQSSFVGRERELGELSGLFTRSRLINLTGPGGVGKTRLAIEAARRWEATGGHGGDVVFVPLEPIQPPRPVVSVLASRLGLRERPGVPWRESALAALRGRPRLLLFDGAEHCREEVAGLAGEFLASAPDLCIVVTSQVVLGVPGEVCWAVPPLDCPSVAAGAPEIAASDAVRLFIARASERLPGFSAADVPPHAVGELCRRLGGLPLAIELIAGWVGTLSMREIVQQRVALLGYDPPGAQGSRKLADVLRASYDLLQPGQQRTLRLLSVFTTPFSLAGTQAVTGVSEQEAAAAVRGLVDASWLVVTRGLEQNRFSMVEAIREFATARLQEAGEAPEARRRHALHFADVATQSLSSLAGPDARRWAARLASAVDDLRAMLQWALENGEIDLGLEAGAALWRWWLTSGPALRWPGLAQQVPHRGRRTPRADGGGKPADWASPVRGRRAGRGERRLRRGGSPGQASSWRLRAARARRGSGPRGHRARIGPALPGRASRGPAQLPDRA